MPVATVEDDAFNRSECWGIFTSAEQVAFAVERSTELVLASTGVYAPGTMFPKHVRGHLANESPETEDNAGLWLFGDLAYRDRLTKTLRVRTIPVRPIDYDVPWWHRFE